MSHSHEQPGAFSLNVPPGAVQVTSIPAGAAICLRTEHGKTVGFTAKHEGWVWWGTAEFRVGKGIVFLEINGPVSQGTWNRMHKQSYL